mmetsp:Transcript_23259/g.34456  ORF Transcript_23259/g.34456 Transcript_23259/m.34456 type:complete len:236 (+) Transcript_23259:2278-2985(+)
MSLPSGFGDSLLLPFDNTARLRLGRCIKLREIFIHQLKALKNIVVTPEKDARVCGMIEFSMEILEILEGKTRNNLWVSTGINRVGIIREDRTLRLAIKTRVRRRIYSFHLIIHNPFVSERFVFVLQFKMPSFLCVYIRIRCRTRMEYSICINIDKVLEILVVLRCQNITGPIRVSHRIQKGLKRSLKKLHKGFLCCVLARTAKYTVLKNMRNTGGISWWRSKSNSKHLVVIIVFN